MATEASQYGDEGLRRVLNARLTATAASWGWTREQIRSAFVIQQFVARLARRDPDTWVLKGGSALQIRSSEARPTADADLAALRGKSEILALLQSCADPLDSRERGRFLVQINSERAGTYSGTVVWQLGEKEFWRAKVDVSFAQHIEWKPELAQVPPIVNDIAGFDQLPPIPIAPPESHLADKIAAMVELHGPAKDRPSTRSHDLADIVILSRCVAIDATKLRSAIATQEELRGIAVGSRLQIPDANWDRDYSRRLRNSPLPSDLRDVHGALTHANQFLEPILSNTLTTGTWNPSQQRWEPPAQTIERESPSVRDLIADAAPSRGRKAKRAPTDMRTSPPHQHELDAGRDRNGPELL